MEAVGWACPQNKGWKAEEADGCLHGPAPAQLPEGVALGGAISWATLPGKGFLPGRKEECQGGFTACGSSQSANQLNGPDSEPISMSSSLAANPKKGSEF